MHMLDLFPTADDLIAARPEEIGTGWVLLAQYRIAQGQQFNGINVLGEIAQRYSGFGHEKDVPLALAEGLAWAQRSNLLVTDPRPTASGWLLLSREGRHFTVEQRERIRLRQLFPDFMLHPEIRAACLAIFNTGQYEAAVFEAFKTVEIAIRDAAGAKPHEHGRAMVMKAFNADNGPLTALDDAYSERESLRDFAAGSIGHFKNPRSHRRTDLADPQEAAEMLVVASHLLRVVRSARSLRDAADDSA